MSRPTEPTAATAYDCELDVCFICRMPRAMREQIDAHAAWMCAHYHLRRVSLASAARDLFRRGLSFCPAERRARRRRAAARQLDLFR